MDSSNLHGLTSNTASLNFVNENKVSTMIQSKRARFFKTYQHQIFSLPDSLMFYITKNPSTAELYQKMIQTCKDFFVKNTILVVHDLDFKDNKWRVRQKPFDLDNLISKFWITFKFGVLPNDFICNPYPNVASSLTRKIFRCDVKTLTLYDQILSFADLCILFSTSEWIDLCNVVVKENDGSNVGIAKIVEVAVNAKDIIFYNPPVTSVTPKTMKELLKIPHFSKLDSFSLCEISQAFDLEAFYVYMKKNAHTKVCVWFGDSISEAYKNRLKKITDEILAIKKFDFKPPCIRFRG